MWAAKKERDFGVNVTMDVYLSVKALRTDHNFQRQNHQDPSVVRYYLMSLPRAVAKNST